MKGSKHLTQYIVLVILVLTKIADSAVAHQPAEPRVVVDHRGVTVPLPHRIERVVTISDGFVEAVMTVLDVQHSIVGIGSPGLVMAGVEASHESISGPPVVYTAGGNTITFLNPWFKKLPLVARPGSGINYETLMRLKPDLLIIQLGACALLANDEKTEKNMRILDTLGVPTVVLRGPNACDDPRLTRISEQIRIIGQVFKRSQRADALADYLDGLVSFVRGRTRDIADANRPRVLMLGLARGARTSGGAGNVRGVDTSDSWILENVVHARNAYSGRGIWNVLGTEQILALNPDVILLITSQGYHPPSELYDAPYCQRLSELSAVKNRRVVSLPFTPCNCDKRIEYPIDIMIIAKAVYPQRFKDISLNTWVLDFYQHVYLVDRNTAKGLRSAQYLDWTKDW